MISSKIWSSSTKFQSCIA
uniref:Uncharacterized protein n=1 Tax=Arundo donax TaxID=35708 RepID=A0A0A8YMK8_ARUDO